jgi:quinol monooxygenase YgiN
MSYQFPAFRRLRGYAFDPSLNLQMDTALINQVTFKVPWEIDAAGNELLKPGPEGEYVKVVDEDETGTRLHAPVDLGDEQLIAQDGLAPSESNPQFHQQMVYAVAMTTIGSFERALRRRVLWSPERREESRRTVETYVPRLRIYPHALPEATAHYYAEQKAVLMGTSDGRGGAVFACLSHDVIAHEVTHALIDGIHPELARKADSPDVPAFHEAFADLVAYFQHFTFPEVVRHQIAKTRGNLLQENFLLQIAGELGRTVGGGRKALRDVLGKIDEKGSWIAREPDPAELDRVTDRYERGGILVRAVFGAFFSIYESRIADLRRIASNGTGVLPQGELHPDLVSRLADEASRVAEILLGLCIRALDYCPPRSIDFGEFLRALITADYDLFPEDERVYRIALIESFRRHGIHPRNVRTLSLESLRWPALEPEAKLPEACLRLLLPLAQKWNLSGDRREIFALLQETRERLRKWLSAHRGELRLPGLDLVPGKILVTSLRPVRRLAADGQPVLEMVVELGGSCGDCALLMDLETGRVRYTIYRQTAAAGDDVVLGNAGNVGDGRQRRAPAFRRLRGFAFDPSLSSGMETAVINQVTFKVPWEEQELPSGKRELRGPVGEYLEVVDYDPASDCFYEPVDLNRKQLLAEDGLPPSEGNPQFHQQMVYGVAMTTIRNFERALGRRALWSPRRWKEEGGGWREEHVPRLRIYPHAVREANAFYSPRKKALLFGYFPASVADSRDHLPGGTVFTCLSHDVIAHETTHALLDGLHPRFAEPSNPDTLAFHEAFADIVALFQHFTFPEVLRHQIARTRGELDRQNLLGQLAQQLGRAIGGHGALRDALGREDDAGIWKPAAPDPRALDKQMEPHDRGAVLVAAVFDAFLSIYKSRVTDLLRIASNGTGVLPQGELHPDLVNRLAGEAAKSAQHVLTMCIRALDYCPPVDITFGDYLRGLITADYDLVQDDPRGYRIAVIEAFRRRGIYPRDVRTLSLDSLRWHTPREAAGDEGFRGILLRLAHKWRLTGDRKVIFNKARGARKALHDWLSRNRSSLKIDTGLDLNDPDAPFEVHSVRPARRIGPDGQSIVEMVVEITQYRWESLVEGQTVIRGEEQTGEGFPFRGGCTLLVDVETGQIRYSIVKDIRNQGRLRRQRAFLQGGTTASLRATYFGGTTDWEDREPFAVLHRSVDRNGEERA